MTESFEARPWIVSREWGVTANEEADQQRENDQFCLHPENQTFLKVKICTSLLTQDLVCSVYNVPLLLTKHLVSGQFIETREFLVLVSARD